MVTRLRSVLNPLWSTGPDAPVVFPLERQTEFHLTANDTVAEIFNDYGGNCCVLNFAS